MPTYKKALVTGGAGFIGSHIVDALIRKRIKVFVVDDLSTGSQKNVNPNAHFTKMSITSPQFPAYVKRIKPDLVIHAAAQIDVRKSVADPVSDARTNILGTLALCQAAVESGTQKLVFISTGGAMYSDRVRPPYAEKQAAEPLSPYGIAKHSSELYLRFFEMQYGISAVVLRLSNVYGPRQDAKGEAGVVAIFTEQFLQGKQPVVNGTGKQTRDFVYVGDVVRACMAAVSKNVTGVFHIGTGKETSVKTLFRKLNQLTGAHAPERHGPAAPGEVMRSALDARKAKKALGWSPAMKLEDGLAKTVAWFKKKK